MGEDINQYFAKDKIFLLKDDDDDDYLLPHNNNDSAFKVEESSELCNARGNASFTDEEDMNKYFSKDCIFLSEDEDEDSKQVKNQWKPRSSRESIPQEDLNKIISPTFDGAYVFPAKTQEHKQETSSNFKAGIEVDDDDYLLPHNYKDSAFKMKHRSELGNTKESTSFTVVMDVNKFFGKDSVFLLEDEDEDTKQMKNKWKPRSSRESITQEYLNKIFSPTFDGKEEVILSKTPEKKENSSNFDENGDIVCKTLLPTRKTCDRKCVRAFRFVKEMISSKYEEIRSSVSSTVKRDNEGPLLLVSIFCISDRLAKVSSITSYENGQCWVAADVSKCVLLYNRDGNLIESVNVGWPVDSLAADKHGNVYMSCPEIKQIRVFNQNRHVKTFRDMTDFPRGIAYMKLSESILVCRNNKRIANSIPSKASNTIEKYSIRGTKSKSEAVTKSLFGYPLRVCVNVNNDCVVSDFANRSITVIDSSGRTRFSFKSSADFPIRYKHSVCCDGDGYIYIFSKGTPNVCILDSNGNVKKMFTCSDLSEDTCFAAVFDTDGYLWLANLNGIIKIFKLNNNL